MHLNIKTSEKIQKKNNWIIEVDGTPILKLGITRLEFSIGQGIKTSIKMEIVADKITFDGKDMDLTVEGDQKILEQMGFVENRAGMVSVPVTVERD